MKIVPLVLLISACTFGSGPEFVVPESDNEGVSSNPSDDAEDGALSTDVIGALSSSVGRVPGTLDQADSDQPSNLQPGVQPDVQPDVQSEAQQDEATTSVATTPTPITNDGTDMQAQAGMVESPDNNPIVRIPRIERSSAPKIDGDTLDYIAGTQLLSGEWQSAVQFNGVNESLGISQYMFGEPGTNNDSASHHWGAMHDGVYLYVLVVADDAGEHFQDTNELRKPWKDDSVELYIDGNNSRLTEYDGVDDYHMTFNLFSSSGVANSSFVSDPKIWQSDTSATLPSDLIFAAGPRKGPTAVNAERGRKDIYEIRLKLSELNIQLNAPFGIELQINDDDNGNDRDAKWGWYHPAGNSSGNDFTWQNPGFMGTAILMQ